MNESETRFYNMAKKQNFGIKHATSYQDKVEHWDFKVWKGDRNLTIEVKGLKRLNRRDGKTQNEWIWVELTGITGHDGWLYGKADFIAFETEYGFLLIKRTLLESLICRKVNFNAWVTMGEDAKYKLYRRFGRKDKLTLINIKDIEAETHIEWID